MLDATQIQALLGDLESDRVERTVATRDTDKFCRAICAFANDLPNHRKPGFLIVGADDAGRVTGLEVTDQLLQNLAAIRSDGLILPLPAMQVYKVDLPGGAVAVAEVQPSDLPPVRYKGRVCVRVGPRRAEANEQEERILSERRALFAATFDVHPVPGAVLSVLALWRFQEYREAVVPADVIEANHRTHEEAMAALRFYDLGRQVATVAGVILFGQKPRFFLPGAYVQFLRFPGATMTERPVDQAEFIGDLRSNIEAIHAKIAGHNTIGLVEIGAFRESSPSAYPEWVLRELIQNALVHRDYAASSPVRFSWFCDRVEIENPGGVHGHLTADRIVGQNSYRNPVLAEALKELGYTNRFGFGLLRCEQLLAENGNRPMLIEADDRRFKVTVWARDTTVP
jgi:ATP-dependent DNA helicase RecG